MIKTIIFDFDGTIADTFSTNIDILKKLAVELGYGDLLKKYDIEDIKNRNFREFLKELKISKIKLFFIIKRFKEEFDKEIDSIKPVKNIKAPLLKLIKNGYRVGILTSNSEDNVTKFLRNNKLELFDFVYSGSSIFGKSKIMGDLLKGQDLKSEEVIYVADETRDIEAAKKAKVKIIAVTWGFNSKKILKNQNPDFLVDRPEGLLRIIDDEKYET